MARRSGTSRTRAAAARDAAALERNLIERVKELNCLYGLAQLIQRCGGSIDNLLRGAAELLPAAWQHPQHAAARVVLEGREYFSAGFGPAEACQRAPLTIEGVRTGFVEVRYLQRLPRADEGPFLKEERALIDAVAAELSRAVETIRADEQRRRSERHLAERVKELNCLYGVARAVETCGGCVGRLMATAVELLPPAWQYPEAACARIVFDGAEWTTDGFARGDAVQSASIMVQALPRGLVEVSYRQQFPPADEGPFLREERALIEAVAAHLGRAVELFSTAEALRSANAQLSVERRALQESNAALRAVLARIEEDKRSIGEAVAANVDRILLPVIDALEIELPPAQRGYTRLLRKNLEDIASPLVDRLWRVGLALTPAEIRVCGMIRMGLSSKEIADLRRVSRATVSRQRESIRRKLGLSGRRVNLATYLQTFGEGLRRAEQRSP